MPWTDLHQACRNGDDTLAQQLIEGGADVNADNGEGRTPLFFALVHHPNEACVRLLLRAGAGATLDLKDIEGRTSLDLALAKGYSDIVQLLQQEKAGAPGGHAIILVFRRYSGESERGVAAEKEVRYGRQIAQALGCVVHERTDAFDASVDMSKDAVREWLMTTAAHQLRGAAFTVFVCGGHGAASAVSTTDHQLISEAHDIENVINTFVRTVPKFYLYQHCMGDMTQGGQRPVADAAAAQVAHRYGNSWRFYASTTGFLAYRLGGDSPFLRAIANVVSRTPTISIAQLKQQIHGEFANAVDQVPHCDSSLDCDDSWRFPSA